MAKKTASVRQTSPYPTLAQTWSNRVVRGEFDNNWKTVAGPAGFVSYVAKLTGASVHVELGNGTEKRIFFKKGGVVTVGTGGVSLYSKPHITKTLGQGNVPNL
ncbi:hypothetical protein M3223_10915 [Paenibacillus pasadenensis]|uniref:hypothetical protein n=1 Tax=Paenibacillus pasadenensis TaxID=217090 RepID=UPI00203B717B|nr:hypothetical protein [Paenibacillus pasadenensis]MCM3747862.1 hypothetical protein [Paenibacillus pasadenensis]